MKNTTPIQDLTKRVHTIFVGRKMHLRINTTLANATKIWETIWKANSGTTVSLYEGYRRDITQQCCSGK